MLCLRQSVVFETVHVKSCVCDSVVFVMVYVVFVMVCVV